MKRPLLSLALIAALAAAGGATAQDWSPAIAINDQAIEDEFPRLFRGPDGAPWMVWMGVDPIELDEEVFYARWNGNQWEILGKVNPPNQIDDLIPRVSSGHDGTVWVLWKVPHLTVPGSYAGVVSRWTAGAWTEPDTIWVDGGRGDVSDIAALAENEIWVVRNGATGVNADSDIWIYHLDDGVLDPELRFADPDSLDTIPQIVVNADGEVWVAWDKSAAATPQFSRLATVHRALGTWSSPKSLAAPLGIDRLALSLDHEGAPWIVCDANDPATGPFSEAIWALRWNGSNWGDPERISDPVAASDTAQVQLSVSDESSKSLWAVWLRHSLFSATRRDPLISEWTGTNWSAPRLAGRLADSTGAESPAAFEEDNGRLWLAYMRANPTTFVSNIVTTYSPFTTTASTSVEFDVKPVVGGVSIYWDTSGAPGVQLLEVLASAGFHTSTRPAPSVPTRLVVTAVAGHARQGSFIDAVPECGAVTTYWVRAHTQTGTEAWLGSGVGAPLCSGIEISSIAPCPSRSGVEMRGALGRSGEGVLEIFGVGGQLVQTIVVGAEAGRFSVWWNGRDRHGSVLPTGVYYARLRSDDEGPSGARKIVFLR